MRAARNVPAPLTFASASASSLFSLGRRDAAPLLIAGIALCCRSNQQGVEAQEGSQVFNADVTLMTLPRHTDTLRKI